MSKCAYCGVEEMDHDYQHLARECYPIQIRAKDAELELLREYLLGMKQSVDPATGYCTCGRYHTDQCDECRTLAHPSQDKQP